MRRGVLFVHNNFPAQFRDLALTLLARGVPCRAIAAASAPGIPDVRMARYRLPRSSTPGILPLATRAEADMIRGTAALGGARALKEDGFDPEVIIGHPGWGGTLFLDEVFPQARRIAFAEFYYHGRGLDIDFDTEFFTLTEDAVLKGKTKNAGMNLAYAEADVIVAPTQFQASTLPRVYRPLTRIIHEGVDVEAIRPAPAAPFALDDGRVIAPGTPVITHVNNYLEPLRGLHIFLRALPRLLEAQPRAQVLIIGSEKSSSYGGQAPEGATWKQVCLDSVAGRLNMSRVHFLGRVEHARMLDALRLSTAHVYYSYPFVLSWSLTEAMAAGCYIIGSDTPPLRDAIEDGVSGRLLPFFDVDALSTAMIGACADPGGFTAQRQAARAAAVAKFSRDKGREAWLGLLREMGVEIP